MGVVMEVEEDLMVVVMEVMVVEEVEEGVMVVVK